MGDVKVEVAAKLSTQIGPPLRNAMSFDKGMLLEEVLTRFGHPPDAKGVFRCLFPEKHRNEDAHPSGQIHRGRAYCYSQQCFGERGADVYEVVGLKEHLLTFAEQKAWIEATFGLNKCPPSIPDILRVYEWTDAEGRKAYHLRINDPQRKFLWNQQADGSGKWILKPCMPDLYQRERVITAQSVIVCAGERDAETLNGWLEQLGQFPQTAATTVYSGEASVKADMLTLLHGKNSVFVVGDNDATGRTYREKVWGFLTGNVKALFPLWVPEPFNDVTEWAERGGTSEAFAALLNAAKSLRTHPLFQGKEPGSSIVFRTASTIRPQKIHWAWEGLVPLNALTIIAGNPGLGKSTMTLEKAAQWSKGLVEGALLGQPVDVVIASGEDSLAHTMVPRLIAAGADLPRIHFIGMEKDRTVNPISIPEDVPGIVQQMQTKQARVLVIDPLACHLSGTINTWRDTDIRRALSPLAELAESLEAAVLVVVHLNKANYSEALYKVGGSTGIVAAARSVLLVAEDPEDEGANVLTHLKCNLASKAISKRYSTQERIVTVENEAITTSAIVWGDDAPELTASSVLHVKKDPEEHSATQEAIEWLEGYLGDLPLTQKQIIGEARKIGIKERTLHRAKKALGVRSFKNGFGKEGIWTWQLPPKTAKGGHESSIGDQNKNSGNLSKTPQEKSYFSNDLSKDCQHTHFGNLKGAGSPALDPWEETIYVD